MEGQERDRQEKERRKQEGEVKVSIEKIIEGLEKLAKKHEVCANEPSLKPLSIVYLNTVTLLRAARVSGDRLRTDYGGWFDLGDYGKTWTAYRRQPEEVTP